MVWRWLWLCACLWLLLPQQAYAQDLELAWLPDDDLPSAEVLAGRHDARLQPVNGDPLIYQPYGGRVWWRVSSRQVVDPGTRPQLVLQTPYDAIVHAWVPGVAGPSTHSLMGAGADLRYSTRALVIELPQGLAAGESVWLAVQGGLPMLVSIQPLDVVHSEDLSHVAWRATLMSSLALLALLALSMGVGLGERSYGWLALLIILSMLYLASAGSDARALPWLGRLLSSEGIGHGALACLAVAVSNIFFRLYLDTRHSLPWVDIWLRLLTYGLLVLAMYSLVGRGDMLFHMANSAMILSAGTVLLVAILRSAQGQRSAMLLLVSWFPLLLLVVGRATELLGYWKAPGWMGEALSASVGFAALVLTVGQADKLLQLRRDRDLASSHADSDMLTGISSRRAIERDLETAFEQRRGEPLSVAWLDIDDFKQINDGHGHQVGDVCLRHVCQRIHGHLRGSDRFGRWGGDELLVLMPDTALEEALLRSERLRGAVNGQPVDIDGKQGVACTISVGVAQWQPGESVASLLRRADRALYAAKKAGRNRVRGIGEDGVLVGGDPIPA